MAPVPPASSKACVRRASRAGADMPSMRMPAPDRADRTAAATETAALSTGTDSSAAGQESGIPLQHAQLVTLQHGHQPWQLRFEAVDGVGLADSRRLEVQWEGPGSDAETDAATMARLQPGHLLGDERRRAQGKKERRGGRPPRRVLLQYEGGHLQRLRHVAGETAVVFAGHHTVEAVRQGERCLGADFADDGGGGQLVVRVEPDGDRPRRKGGGRRDPRRVRHGDPARDHSACRARAGCTRQANQAGPDATRTAMRRTAGMHSTTRMPGTTDDV